MRFRMGKGQVIAFDAFIEKKVETMRDELGFYPASKEIGAQCTPPQPSDCVFRSLRRLAAAGRLSKEALQVYNAKNNQKYIQEDSHDEKNSKNRQSKITKWKTVGDKRSRHA